ncbi:MAG: methionine--tRNA ligase [Candidatus Doudnabacteria bacterium RIFCSPHIGHO2_01_FULL_43_23]|uniref:Methionine--tRNA ligase n=1 Tax=Candidatus Doudnabacteria bacterium RIFCSPHIGHO2_01_FULL_43_23 TaxID=1817822 RepID=A0A1F5NTT1_9BACT|nr:MAG: methionine--tRNA ligase [Candidatus Doudnabacteria bacterium RIFCSPHIGHO2_01_FULL_43_23]
MTDSKKKFYITTSIPYVNAKPHIGFALELAQADTIARFHHLSGEDVFFLTGTDEHGSKVPKAAEQAGKKIPDFVNEISDKFRALTRTLDISNSHFIRTIEQGHKNTVQKFWEKAKANGDIYKSRYEGLYCIGCEKYVTESELVNGKCAIHGTIPEKLSEENYFFKLSKYQKPLEEYFKKHKDFVRPQKRFNEILAFIAEGLTDISISRSKKTLSWGIPVPDDQEQIIYIWFDALINYLSGIGYYEEDGTFKKFWPADIHLVGKDIVRFHAALWPAMLMSAGIELPKQILVHGFINVDGKKMSKSSGSVIDPEELVKKYGVDAVRYYLLREIPSGEDGDFTLEKFERRYSADLANDLGNLVSRVTNLIEKNANGLIPEIVESPKTAENLEKHITEFRLHDALAEIWENISWANQFVDKSKLWELPKKDPKLFEQAISSLAALLKQVSLELAPFLPETASKIDKILSADHIKKAEPLFPRIP